MARKYHINPETGRANVCKAHTRSCPVGGSEDHFDSPDKARAAYEHRMKPESASPQRRPSLTANS